MRGGGGAFTRVAPRQSTKLTAVIRLDLGGNLMAWIKVCADVLSTLH